MSEGSRHLRRQIAAILGVAAIAIYSVDEQIPTCILAAPPEAIAMASCPAQQLMPHSHGDSAALLPRIGQLTGLSISTSTSFGAMTDATPGLLASAADCPDKAKPLDHNHGDDPAPTEEMPFLLRNSAATFFANEYVPRRREFIQPDQYNNIAVMIPPSCPAKDEAPLHLERKEAREVTGSGNLIADASMIEGSDSVLPPFVANHQQFVENPAPVFIPAQRSSLITVLTQYPKA
jgi:hypothetical protein